MAMTAATATVAMMATSVEIRGASAACAGSIGVAGVGAGSTDRYVVVVEP